MLATKVFLERELYNGVIYPESDGQPMSDNTVQFHWLTTIKGNVEAMVADAPNVFVAGDLLWYPVEGHPELRMAPDVMVVFGRPKGDRGSYMQFREANIPPQVVFEILSPGNTPPEMLRKFQFYDRYSVEEYYLYDPASETLAGWLRSAGHLTPITDLLDWVSPRLGIRFTPAATGLQIYRPDGTNFLSYVELDELHQQEQLRAIFAEGRAEQAEARATRLAAKLRALGIDPDEVV
jgi:Uma2 family endonuclease